MVLSMTESTGKKPKARFVQGDRKNIGVTLGEGEFEFLREKSLKEQVSMSAVIRRLVREEMGRTQERRER